MKRPASPAMNAAPARYATLCNPPHPLPAPLPPPKSSTEMLSCDNKFFCDACGCLQEAQKRMKVKALPPCLIFHLKRFKYLKHINRLGGWGRGWVGGWTGGRGWPAVGGVAGRRGAVVAS